MVERTQRLNLNKITPIDIGGLFSKLKKRTILHSKYFNTHFEYSNTNYYLSGQSRAVDLHGHASLAHGR